ncbi:ATP-dependent helicase/deoxyribonuclease subunit B [Dissostichus eleginoides]|uniref:ATP-dependent helicase/deoxyribonuclease subunit B n=1 Tax=Dissostichus eleginoides TaxID=100907 RepID=A0AAD9BMG1_DISEL|nr:ATP-dependent helicase/deoxyribonuclease subunit B [Dissostichus eleginoides]
MSPVSVRNIEHAVTHTGSIALALISQVISDIFSHLAKDSSVPNALFQTSSRNVSESFPLEVTMDWWSERFWVIVDIWCMAWLVYAVVSLFKRNAHGCAAWLSGTDMISMEQFSSSGLYRSRFNMLFMSYSNLVKHKERLVSSNQNVIWWTRYLTHNGLALFVWWTLLKAMLGFGIVLKYKAGVSDPLVSTVVLSSFLLTKYMRYTFTVYPILILGLGAMFTRSYRIHDLAANTIYCGSLMLLMTMMSLIQLILACLHTDKPIKPAAMEPSVWHTDLQRDEFKKDLCKN